MLSYRYFVVDLTRWVFPFSCSFILHSWSSFGLCCEVFETKFNLRCLFDMICHEVNWCSENYLWLGFLVIRLYLSGKEVFKSMGFWESWENLLLWFCRRYFPSSKLLKTIYPLSFSSLLISYFPIFFHCLPHAHAYRKEHFKVISQGFTSWIRSLLSYD